ncbi:ATP-binding protein [Salmonella enterica subsp. enterica serovar Senftenberg]|nr:ATP-binding protein [Salmonella enterica subsp. enterica serovar Senftenberg]
MNREEASLFFRLLNRRYEKASIILTSNKGSLTGRDVRRQRASHGDPDRLLHHSTTLNIKGRATG